MTITLTEYEILKRIQTSGVTIITQCTYTNSNRKPYGKREMNACWELVRRGWVMIVTENVVTTRIAQFSTRQIIEIKLRAGKLYPEDWIRSLIKEEELAAS